MAQSDTAETTINLSTFSEADRLTYRRFYRGLRLSPERPLYAMNRAAARHHIVVVMESIGVRP